MLERSTNNIITTSIDQLSSLIKSATILGEPVIISQNEAIVPISKVSFGFGSGAADLITKLKENTSLIYEDQSTPCAGGLLGGVAVIPEAIIYLYQGNDILHTPSSPFSQDPSSFLLFQRPYI